MVTQTEAPQKQRKPEGVVSPPGYMRLDELAHMLGVCCRTVKRWNTLRIGPPRKKIGRQVYYHRESIMRWLSEQEVGPRRSKRQRAAV